MPPDFSHESLAPSPVCGVDEAGRGPLAGPVVAGAVILHSPPPPGINDSKKLTATARESLFDALQPLAHIGIGIASVEEIDRLNILQATLLAMKRAVEALPVTPAFALIDGNRAPMLACPARTLVKGDALSLSIASASIVAKVTRDRLMRELAAMHPVYGFEKHAGYGTKAHLEALKTHGPCPAHRLSFAPIRLAAA